MLLRRFSDQLVTTVSIMYLKLSEATALNFLGPLTAMILTRYLDFGTFEVIDRIGALVALLGVILVVQPDTLFGSQSTLKSARQSTADDGAKGRMMGFGFGVMSVIGGAVSRCLLATKGVHFVLTMGKDCSHCDSIHRAERASNIQCHVFRLDYRTGDDCRVLPDGERTLDDERAFVVETRTTRWFRLRNGEWAMSTTNCVS